MELEQNIKPIELEEMHTLLLDILDVFHNFCEENNLKYVLCGGTLIGAIRHKGFIPWDDDIDVQMPVEDYKKLKELWKDNEKYKLIYAGKKGANYYYPFYKLTNAHTDGYSKEYSNDTFGVSIDIFPTYDVSTKKVDKIQKKIDSYFEAVLFLVLRRKKREKGNFFKSLFYHIKTVARFFKNIWCRFRIFVLKEEELLKHFKGTDCIMCVWNYKKAPQYPYNTYSERIVVDFEGRKKYYAPRDYDEFLRNQYGDYMALPPEDKRQSDHDYVYYFTK